MVHAGIFGVHAYLLSGFLAEIPRININTLKSILIVIAISTVYGLFIEIIQYFIPGRSFEILDIIANFIGISIASIFFQIKINY